MQNCELLVNGLFWQDFPQCACVGLACNSTTTLAQALWYVCRRDAHTPAQSPFGASLQDYLRTLHLPAAEAKHAQRLCKLHDFSSARAHLIPSVPGWHEGASSLDKRDPGYIDTQREA